MNGSLIPDQLLNCVIQILQCHDLMSVDGITSLQLLCLKHTGVSDYWGWHVSAVIIISPDFGFHGWCKSEHPKYLKVGHTIFKWAMKEEQRGQILQIADQKTSPDWTLQLSWMLLEGLDFTSSWWLHLINIWQFDKAIFFSFKTLYYSSTTMNFLPAKVSIHDRPYVITFIFYGWLPEQWLHYVVECSRR